MKPIWPKLASQTKQLDNSIVFGLVSVVKALKSRSFYNLFTSQLTDYSENRTFLVYVNWNAWNAYHKSEIYLCS